MSDEAGKMFDAGYSLAHGVVAPVFIQKYGLTVGYSYTDLCTDITWLRIGTHERQTNYYNDTKNTAYTKSSYYVSGTRSDSSTVLHFSSMKFRKPTLLSNVLLWYIFDRINLINKFG